MIARISHDEWRTLAEAYAFFGNSLLKPMTQTADVGLDPAFWEAFPDFGDADIAAAARACADHAREARAAAAEAGEDAVVRCAVEYTRLFIGPPRPAAAPWETMHRHAGYVEGVGFGEATFEMRALLREAGLALSGENHQYEDHLGIELLYLSELCRRSANAGEGDTAGDAVECHAAKHASENDAMAGADNHAADEIAVRAFVLEHPLGWIDSLACDVRAAASGGYFENLLALLEAVLRWHAQR